DCGLLMERDWLVIPNIESRRGVEVQSNIPKGQEKAWVEMRRAIPRLDDAMVRRRTTECEALRNGGELLVVAGSYLSDAFPNPQRIDCPPDDVLRSMAIRPLASDAYVSDHLTCCSPCFKAYTGHLAQARAKPLRSAWIRRSAVAIGIAAVLVI